MSPLTILPVILYIILSASAFIFTRGENQSLIQSVGDFVVFTYSYNYYYPLITVFKFIGHIYVIIAGVTPSIFMLSGMEIKQKFTQTVT